MPAPARSLHPDRARALVDGRAVTLAQASLPLEDAGVARGDGGFETVGVWDGRAFRLDDHLVRLDATLAALHLPPAPRDALADDAAALLDGVDEDAALRLYVTASGTRIATLSPLPARPTAHALEPVPAPWIQPSEVWPAAGAKSMSYGPNMTATRVAQRAGADDALLLGVPDGHVLEGPTFGVVVVVDGDLHVPEVALGIVDSISRRTLLEVAVDAGLTVHPGRFGLDLIARADEVVVSSSLRPATAVRRVGDRVLPAGAPVAAALDRGLQARRRG